MNYIPNNKYLRGVIRKFKILRDVTSFPYISGDTYKSLCDIVLNSNSFDSLQKRDIENKAIFLSADIAEPFIKWLRKTRNLKLDRSKLVIHNGDLIPSTSDINYLGERFKQLYCVNWLGQNENVFPIPIGLENISYTLNGVPSDYKVDPQRSWKDRPINLLVAFSLSTNFHERSKALEISKSLDNTYIVSNHLAPKEYQALLRKSKFVLSPPGNGPDCHRTWEAIYSGAIPIVKTNVWGFPELTRQRCVMEIDEWDALLEASFSGYAPLNDPILFLRENYLDKFL